MDLTTARLNRDTSVFSSDRTFRYWWRDAWGRGELDAAHHGRALFVFLCPREGPMNPAHRATLRRIAGGYSRNIGVAHLFNAMTPATEIMRLADPVGRYGDKALSSAVLWAGESFDVWNRPGLVFLCLGSPPWPVTAYQAKLDARKALLLDRIKRAGHSVVLRAAGPAEPGGHPPNPLYESAAS